MLTTFTTGEPTLTVIALGALSGMGMVAGYVVLVPVCAGIDFALKLWRRHRG